MSQIWLAFITGLTTGGISCFAVQGGLLASALSSQKKEAQKNTITWFLVAKLVGYTFLGALLGILGSSILITPKLQGWMQIFAGLFMLASAGKLMDIHPIFRHFTFTPPKSVFRILRKTSLNENTFAPVLLGFLTILIPCGITQSMMLLSIASGSVWLGGLILGSFALGTSPVFFGLGLASSEFLKRKTLKYVSSFAIIFLALVSINTGQVLRGSVHTFQNYYLALTGGLNQDVESASIDELSDSAKQEVTINVLSSGYRSDTKTLKAGVPVNLKLITKNTGGCSRAFTIPAYNISQILPETGTTKLEFTPTKKGRLTYTCSMGMYTGYFDVI